MNLFRIMILLSLVATAAIGLFVYVAQPRRRVNQAFLFLSLSLMAWQSALWGSSLAVTESGLEFWIRQASAISALIPPSINLLRLSILKPSRSFPRLVRSNQLWFGFWAGVGLICQTPAFLRGVRPAAPGELLAHPSYGWGFLLFSLYFVCSWITLFQRLLKSKRKARGFTQSEIEYLLLSCAVSLFVGVFFLIVPNLTGMHDLGVGLPLSVILFSGITAYGIATRGILDVPVVARRVVALSMLGVYLVVLYAAVLFGMRHLLPRIGQDAEPLASILAACAVVFSISPAKGLLQRLANRLFLGTPPLDVGEALREASHNLHTIQTSEELYQRFSSLLADVLNAQNVRIYLREEGRYSLVYPHQSGRAFPMDHALPTLLEEDCSPMICELIDRTRNGTVPTDLRQELADRDISVAVGFYPQIRLEGFFLLGPRISGRIYGQIECRVLEGMRDLFSVAHENAMLYEKIRRTERLASIGTLAAGMAHEIKNPLVTLKTFTQLVPERHDDPEFRETFSKLVGSEIERIDTLVNQLLNFARPVKPDFRPMSLQASLREQLSGFEEQALKDGIDLQTRFQAKRERILGDANLLQQVFLNLLLNARDAMTDGGTLTLKCMDGDTGIVVEVADTGQGIEPEVLDHIFDPFYTTKSHGTGLGLAVAHRILTEHNVKVTVRSAPGTGTTFRLVFPVLPEEVPS